MSFDITRGLGGDYMREELSDLNMDGLREMLDRCLEDNLLVIAAHVQKEIERREKEALRGR